MKKSSSGMISIHADNKEKSLLVVGGYYGESPRYKQPGAQYTDGRTDKIHIFNVTTSEYIIVSYYIQYFCVKMIPNKHNLLYNVLSDCIYDEYKR